MVLTIFRHLSPLSTHIFKHLLSLLGFSIILYLNVLPIMIIVHVLPCRTLHSCSSIVYVIVFLVLVVSPRAECVQRNPVEQSMLSRSSVRGTCVSYIYRHGEISRATVASYPVYQLKQRHDGQGGWLRGYSPQTIFFLE